MKILVTVKRVPDPEARVKLKEDGSGIDTTNVKFVVNPFDEIAVEEGLRKKEKHGGEVVVVAIGPSECTEQIRTALAMGADRGILVETEKALDSDTIARILVKVIQEEEPDIVLMGKQAVDDDSNQAGQLLAAYLGWPQATFASKVDISEDLKKVTIVREVDGGLETVEVELPAIITADLRLNEPRYASLPGIMKARSKPLKIVKAEELGIDITPKVELLKLEAPPERKGGIIVKEIDELIEKLDKEAKVLPF